MLYNQKVCSRQNAGTVDEYLHALFEEPNWQDVEIGESEESAKSSAASSRVFSEAEESEDKESEDEDDELRSGSNIV